MTAVPTITPDLLASAMTYAEFMALAKALLADHKTTSDDPQYNTDRIITLTNLNVHRISRLERTIQLNPDLIAVVQAVPEPWTWLVLVESWCGDVAQCLFKQIADLNPANTLTELGTWGPRPATIQTLMNGWKAEQLPVDVLLERMHGWYAKDYTHSLQMELLTLIRVWRER